MPGERKARPATVPHTFEVRAVDTSGNVDATPARFDRAEPKAIINGGTTTSASMTFNSR